MDVLLARLRRQLLLFLLLLPLWIQAVAQTAVTRDTNGMRCGDTLKMLRLEYADAGVSGRGVTWDFSRLGVTDGNYVVPIFCHEGKVVQAECGFLFKYNTSGDTLSIACIENALQKTSYSRPILSLTYPFSFGNSVTADFCGIGRYCDTYVLSEQGVAKSEADAEGILILFDCDTLYNVLRVHEHRQSAIALSKDDADADTMCMERVEDIYSWYAGGFRYPVFKTVSYHYSSSGCIVSSGNYSLRSIRQLKEISVWDTSRNDRMHSKKFRLRHSGEPRFFLNEIDIFSFADKEDTADTVFIGKYKFTYNDGDKLPGNYATTAADHWGYYNQREYTLADCNRADFYNLRNPNSATMQYGSLRSMTYPTGGTTVLEYEPHDYSHYISDTRDKLIEKDSIAGGLRIKRITDYEDETCRNVLSSRTFSYVANGKSSGILYAKPKYFWPRWAMKTRSGGAVKSASMAMFRSSSIIPLANALHPHVTYSQVEETNADGSRNVYKFTEEWTGKNNDEGFFLKYHDTATSPYDHFSEKNFARGRLKEKTMYDAVGKLVCRETYKDTLCNDTQKDFVVTSGVIPFFNGIIAGGLYKLYYQKSRPSSVVRCTATQTVDIKETNSWQYKRTELGLTSGKRHKGQAFVMTKAWKTRGTTSIGSMYDYPFESADSVLRNWALSKHFLVPNIEKQFENGSRVKTVDCKYSKVTKGDKMFVAPYMVTVTTPQNVSDTLVTYLAYTKTGQLQCYRQAGQSATSLLWGMGDNFLMMKCENLNLSNTDVVQFEGDGFFDIDNVLDIQKKFRNTHSAAQTTSYTYAPTCGVTSITTPDGKTTYYNYAPGMRLSEVLNNNSKPLQRYEYNFRNR